MTTDEVIDLLTVIASYDRRTVGDADVVAWSAAIGDLEFGDARDAVVAHYQETDRWIGPSHIRQRVRAMRVDRLMRNPIPDPPDHVLDDPDPMAYTRWESEQRQRIMARPADAVPAIEGSRH